MTPSPPERIFHIATAADWRRTLASGTYTTSTIGAPSRRRGSSTPAGVTRCRACSTATTAAPASTSCCSRSTPSRLTHAEVRVEPVGVFLEFTKSFGFGINCYYDKSMLTVRYKLWE